MHTPFARLFFALFVALLAHLALAQEGGKVPGLDESKIPEWIKRQAAAPQKAILGSTKPKPEGVPVHTVRPVLKPPAPPAAESAASAPTAQPGPPPAVAPAPASSSPAASAPNPAPETVPAAPAPATAAPTVPPAPSLAAEPANPAQPPSAAEPELRLLEKTNPVLSEDLIDARLGDASVTVAFTVGTQGEVIAPQIVASSDRRLNRAVLRAVAEWRYAPVSTPRPHTVKFSFAVTP